MADEPEQPDDEADDDEATDGQAEYVDPCISIGDGECWISDAGLLMPNEDDATDND